jgi:hypothetical protein
MHNAMPQNSITRSRHCFSDLWTQDIADTRLQAVFACSFVFELITLYLRVVIAFGCALTTCAMWKFSILYSVFPDGLHVTQSHSHAEWSGRCRTALTGVYCELDVASLGRVLLFHLVGRGYKGPPADQLLC